MSDHGTNPLLSQVQRLTELSIQLSAENNTDLLLEKILTGARELTHADAGTLYLLKDNTLHFEIIQNDELQLYLGGSTGQPASFKPIPLVSTDGQPNQNNVVTAAVHMDKTINIDDAYQSQEFDFTGTRKVDGETGYRSQSFLVIPMKDHQNEIIGALQLINAKEDAQIRPFNAEEQRFAESLTSLAAATLTKKRLLEAQKALFESFIQLIAKAIDAKSPYTGGHCQRVPVLTMMIADAAQNSKQGNLKNFSLDETKLYELRIAAWLHDCGKVSTPEYVMDKGSKLETIMDGVDQVRLRFEINKRDQALKALGHTLESAVKAHPDLDASLKQLSDDLAFIETANVGGEFMADEERDRLKQISERYSWNHGAQTHAILSEQELTNLGISKGTLNDDERNIINNHVVVTKDMLSALPYPKGLERIPEIAGAHHERLDGKGYPDHLKAPEICMQTRMLTIADVFEALTAADRPYKPAKTLSESLKILGFMKKDSHVDPDLFDLFIREKIYLTYAEQFLSPDQIDEVDHSKIPGYEE